MNEQFKQPLMIGLIAGGLTVIAYQFGFNWAGAMSGFAIAIILGAVIGGVAFGITYAVTKDR